MIVSQGNKLPLTSLFYVQNLSATLHVEISHLIYFDYKFIPLPQHCCQHAKFHLEIFLDCLYGNYVVLKLYHVFVASNLSDEFPYPSNHPREP
ncbi:CLUMA_CG019853, isoform A [Clunio marinus]|uniref:CLUMA_CG019853, isoform A n=1 Tax=Clunio marinus TaxID=568069 RepID=A0A1J1J6Q2_9DIPT|nr:CLUMA_CG019853, isoform A [Clunio marinus]